MIRAAQPASRRPPNAAQLPELPTQPLSRLGGQDHRPVCPRPQNPPGGPPSGPRAPLHFRAKQELRSRRPPEQEGIPAGGGGRTASAGEDGHGRTGEIAVLNARAGGRLRGAPNRIKKPSFWTEHPGGLLASVWVDIETGGEQWKPPYLANKKER